MNHGLTQMCCLTGAAEANADVRGSEGGAVPIFADSLEFRIQRPEFRIPEPEVLFVPWCLGGEFRSLFQEVK